MSVKRNKTQATARLLKENLRLANEKWGATTAELSIEVLKAHTLDFRLSVAAGDLILLHKGWYVTHVGLIRLSWRRRCAAIHVEAVPSLSELDIGRWTFKATVFRSRTCKGFVGYGDADPSNVNSTVRGAEMRVAETRAVNRALRKAYGIGICSVEEIGSFAGPVEPPASAKKIPPQPVNGHSKTSAPLVRDRLRQIIRQHQLDPNLVKAYAVDFCGTNALRDAKREQVENFVTHLSDWAVNDRNALLCQLNSYLTGQEGAA